MSATAISSCGTFLAIGATVLLTAAPVLAQARGGAPVGGLQGGGYHPGSSHSGPHFQYSPSRSTYAPYVNQAPTYPGYFQQGYRPFYGSYPQGFGVAIGRPPTSSRSPSYTGTGDENLPWYADADGPARGFRAIFPALPAPPQAPLDPTAHIKVTVPANAEVWFEGYKTASKGATREFQSPDLTPGKQYAYKVRARWKEDGRQVTQTQKVDVSAGARAQVIFPSQAAAR
jgi:uncharacterized protein (TIGR03000 family)